MKKCRISDPGTRRCGRLSYRQFTGGNNTNDMFVKQTAFPAYSYPSVVAAVADSTYIELENSLGGTSSVLDVAAQPGKYQHKMMYRMLMTAGGVLAAIIVLGVVVRRKSKREDV